VTPLVNRTRVSKSIPRRLAREGKLHVYRSLPSGRMGVGRLLDSLLLGLRQARSMRNRYLHSRDRIVEELLGSIDERPHAVLSVPCGIAREILEAACALRERAAGVYQSTTFHIMDLDPAPLEHTRRLARDHGISCIVEHRADAFDAAAYPATLDVIVSTGFGEFLDDEQLMRFYEVCRLALRPGGLFVTSGMSGRPVADYLMRELAEIRVHYRAQDRLSDLATRAGFRSIGVRTDSVGLQHLMTARS